MSVARFYDWTDDLGDCFSVSRLYREIASIPRLDSKGTLRGSQLTLNGNVGNGVGSSNSSTPMVSIANATGAVVHHGAKGRGHPQFYVSPGRMFVRDKKALTRGEREIIEGIYKNRGDVAASSKDAMCCSEFQVRSHQEAWLVGKSGAVPCASMAEGAHGAIGRAIMRGIALDTANKIIGGGSQQDIRSQTAASSASANDISSPTSQVIIPGDINTSHERKQRVEKYSTFPTGKQPASLPELADDKETHDNSKRLFHGQNPTDYWDSRPSAPPSSPNRFEESPPSTPIPQSPPAIPLDPSPLRNCGSLASDKLLAMRTNLPPNTIILAEKIPSVPSSERSNKQKLSHSGTSAHNIFNGKIVCPGQHMDWSSQSEDFSETSDNNLNIARDGKHRPNMFFGSDFDAMSNRPAESEKDKKKVQVRVYLPSVGAEIYEDDVSIKSSLTKERPLSETALKSKSQGQNIKLS